MAGVASSVRRSFWKRYRGEEHSKQTSRDLLMRLGSTSGTFPERPGSVPSRSGDVRGCPGASPEYAGSVPEATQF